MEEVEVEIARDGAGAGGTRRHDLHMILVIESQTVKGEADSHDEMSSTVRHQHVRTVPGST